MVLFSDVLNVSGRLLVPKGTVIDEAHLKVFRTWGVTEIDVESEDGLEEVKPDNIPEEFLKQAQQELEKRLLKNDMAHPFIKEMHELAVRYVAADLMREKQS